MLVTVLPHSKVVYNSKEEIKWPDVECNIGTFYLIKYDFFFFFFSNVCFGMQSAVNKQSLLDEWTANVTT